MNSSHIKICNVELLTELFGRFPTFHDAEVLRLELDRTDGDGPSLLSVIHMWEMTSDVDLNGTFKRRNSVEVRIRFSKIENLTIDDFNHQNVLSDLYFEDSKNGLSEFKIMFEGIYGLHAEFECERVSIESVRPYKPATEAHPVR
jgi:hypothetical protein